MIATLKRAIRPEQIRELSLFILIVAALLFFGTQIDSYFTARTFTRISTSVALVAVVAVGQTLVVLTRNIDLSVGSIVGFTAYFVGIHLAGNKDLSPLLVVALSMGVGLLLGAINGLLVAYGRIPSIIVTLGTLAIYRGVLVQFSASRTVTVASLPTWLVDLPRVNSFTIGELEFRLLVVIALIVVALFQLFVGFSWFGRRLYAIGSNPDAAKMAGLPSRRLILLAYAMCGALSGLGGFMFLARFGNVTVEAAQGLELQVVAAVVVGGVNIFGGSGTMIGALLGAVLIGTLEQSLLRMPNLSEFWRDAVLGILILFSVAADAVLLNRLRNLWARDEQINANATPESDRSKGKETPSHVS